MFKFFKKVDFESEFNAMFNEKAIGKFHEWNNKKGINKAIEFTAKEKNQICGWIGEAKLNGNQYRVEYYK